MCGRYVMVSSVKRIEERFKVKTPHPELYTPDVNKSVGEIAPVITGTAPETLQFFQFGFSPSWAKKQCYLFNARSEGDLNKENDPLYHGAKGITQKPMFRNAIRSQRCLVIADAFVEGPALEKLNRPYVVYRIDGQRPFALAGIWDQWTDKTSGEIVHSFAILTTTANKLLQNIGHPRSPVMLSPEDEQIWLNTKSPLADVLSLLHPIPEGLLNAYPISSEIKNPRASGVELLKPAGPRVFSEHHYDIQQDLSLFGMGETRAHQRKNNENNQ